MIREEAGSSNLFFTNVSAILKHFPIISPEDKFSMDDLATQQQYNDTGEINKNDSSYKGTNQNAEFNLGKLTF